MSNNNRQRTTTTAEHTGQKGRARDNTKNMGNTIRGKEDKKERGIEQQ